jgi:hypothetical protein
MPMLDVRSFSALVDDSRDLVESIEELDRRLSDVRTSALLHSARFFMAAMETYFETVEDAAVPEVSADSLPESLMGLVEEAFAVASRISSTTGGPGSSALVHHASALRGAAEIYWQSRRRLATEILRQLELPHSTMSSLAKVVG